MRLPEKSLIEMGADLNSDKYSYYGMEYKGNPSEFRYAGNEGIVDIIEDESSVYKKQYEAVKAYYEELKEKYPSR